MKFPNYIKLIIIILIFVIIYFTFIKNFITQEDFLQRNDKKQKSFIIIEPINGLCDRIYAIISWKVLADKLNKKLYIYWKPSKQFSNIKFENLFANNLNLNFIDNKKFQSLIKKVNHKLINKNDFNNTKKKFEQIYKDFFLQALEIKNKSLGIRTKKSNKIFRDTDNIYYRGYLRPTGEPQVRFATCVQKNYQKLINKTDKILREDVIPAPHVQSIINKYIKQKLSKNGQIDKNIIGVHIRRGDTFKQFQSIYKLHDMKLKTDALYIKDMNKEIKLNKNVKFFLATDNKKSFNKFKKIYKNRIISFPQKFYDQNCTKKQCNLMNQYKRGQHYAVIDLFLLTQFKKLIGCYTSGFVKFYCIKKNVSLKSYMYKNNQHTF
jgi:hypothetical protein